METDGEEAAGDIRGKAPASGSKGGSIGGSNGMTGFIWIRFGTSLFEDEVGKEKQQLQISVSVS